MWTLDLSASMVSEQNRILINVMTEKRKEKHSAHGEFSRDT